jgi:hypothetical protein
LVKGQFQCTEQNPDLAARIAEAVMDTVVMEEVEGAAVMATLVMEEEVMLPVEGAAAVITQ